MNGTINTFCHVIRLSLPSICYQLCLCLDEVDCDRMSLVDFNQEVNDHGCLHIAVIALGDASAALFQAVMNELSLLPPIQLVEPKGTVLFLRFLDSLELPSWALGGPKWNEFSAHKQILGVLGISQCLDIDDLDNVKAGFKSYCAKFKSSLCDSRCIVYGSRTEIGQHLDPRKGYRLVDLNSEQELYTSGDINVDAVQEIVTDFALAIYITVKSRIAQLEKNVLTSLGRSESLKLLKSPFELKEFSRSDEDDSRLVYTGVHVWVTQSCKPYPLFRTVNILILTRPKIAVHTPTHSRTHTHTHSLKGASHLIFCVCVFLCG